MVGPGKFGKSNMDSTQPMKTKAMKVILSRLGKRDRRGHSMANRMQTRALIPATSPHFKLDLPLFSALASDSLLA